MKFKVGQDLVNKYPDIKIGVIIASDADNARRNKEIEKLLESVHGEVKSNFDIGTLMEHPVIATWRKIYSDFVLKGRKVQAINNLVGLYNYTSLKYVIPVGGEDFDKIKGDIHLTFANGDEIFVPLNTENVEHPYKGEVVYCDDDNNVLCRRWNWRESEKTTLTESTKNCIIVIEGFNSTVEITMKELSTHKVL